MLLIPYWFAKLLQIIIDFRSKRLLIKISQSTFENKVDIRLLNIYSQKLINKNINNKKSWLTLLYSVLVVGVIDISSGLLSKYFFELFSILNENYSQYKILILLLIAALMFYWFLFSDDS